MDVGSVKTAKRAGEGHKQLASALKEKTVTLDPHGAEMGENGDGDGAAGGGVAGEGGRANGGGGTLAQAENKRLQRLQRNKAWNASQKASPSHKGSHGERHEKRTQKALNILSRLLCPKTFSSCVVHYKRTIHSSSPKHSSQRGDYITEGIVYWR